VSNEVLKVDDNLFQHFVPSKKSSFFYYIQSCHLRFAMYPKMYLFCNRLLDKDLRVDINILFLKMYFQVFDDLRFQHSLPQNVFPSIPTSSKTVFIFNSYFLFSETTSAA
jgi:hypothetical protein